MEKNSSLPLMEMFPTIQGEGYHQGRAAFFVRLAGCDVGCSWCDVKESWDASAHPEIEINNIVKYALTSPSRLAVITGGEPLIYDLTILTNKFHDAGFNNHIETSGAYNLSGSFDWITLSPKKFKPAKDEFFELADELKVIVCNNSDLEWAEKLGKKMKKPNHKLFLQPEWSKSEKVMPSIVDFIMTNPNWEISLQIHKYMKIP